MPSAAAMASTVPPRSTTATSRTGTAAGLVDGVGRLQQRGAPGHRVLGDHHPVAGIEGAGDPPAAPVVLGLLAHAEGLEHPPRVAATPAVTKATGSAPMVRPPMAVASSGRTERTPSATSTMASGRHTVCFESMNQLLRRPDLSTKSPRLTECSSRWCAERLELGGRERGGHAGRAAAGRRRPSDRTGLGPDQLDATLAGLDPADHQRRRPRPPREAPTRASSTPSASTTSTMPSPRLNTRAISSSATWPEATDLPEDGGHLPRPAIDARRRRPVGKGPGQVALEPAPGDVGHGVDRRRAAMAARTAGV